MDGRCYHRAMDDRERIFRYNAWANERILGAATRLGQEQASTPVAGIYGSVLETARHMLGVERVYLELMGGNPPALPEDLDAAGLKETAADLGSAYQAFLASLSIADLGRRFRVPWFDREFTVSDGLAQVATHSIEHRADLASAISRLGVATPPLDYIFWVMATEA